MVIPRPQVDYRPTRRPRRMEGYSCADCYFPAQSGNAVTLYSCARNVDGALDIPLGPEPNASASLRSVKL